MSDHITGSASGSTSDSRTASVIAQLPKAELHLDLKPELVRASNAG